MCNERDYTMLEDYCLKCANNKGGNLLENPTCTTCDNLEITKWDEFKPIEEELRPCPFCGGDVKIRISNDTFPVYGIDHLCDNNKLSIKLHWYSTPKEAVEAWNIRKRGG